MNKLYTANAPDCYYIKTDIKGIINLETRGEAMKKNLFLLFICVFLVGCQQSADQNTTADSIVVSEVTISPVTEMDLTLKEALEIAHKEAFKWNKKAMLYSGTSVDKDKTPKGMEGRRKHWNIEFGIPNKTDYYLVTIQNGKASDKVHLPNELKPMSKNYFISSVEEFKYDTPELLKKAQKNTKIYPGDIFAKGYNFGFIKDPEKNFPIVMVIGWDQAKKNMIYSMFNAVTGDLDEVFEREQYKN